MPSKLWRKWIFITCVFFVCMIGIIQFPRSRAELINNLNKSIRLGLDLKGGTYLEMQIQVQDAFKAEADRSMEQLHEALDKAGIANVVMERNEPDSVESAEEIQISIRGIQPSQVSDVRRMVEETLGRSWIVLPHGGSVIHLGIRKEQALLMRRETINRCIHTIQRKIDSLGLAETVVQQRGGSDSAEVLVQLPGVDDPIRVKEIIRTQAQLELCPLISGPYFSRAEALNNRNGVLPVNARLIQEPSPSGNGVIWWLISRSPVVTGIDLRDARAEASDIPGHYDTHFTLTPDAAERFEKFTKSNLGNRLAIVLDNDVLNIPRIDTVIADQGRITGARSFQDAAELAINLKSGSLPAGMKIMAENTVGPSLGADSIHRGILAAVTGLALVIASMISYYRAAGLNAVAALLLNAILTIAALSWLDWTWTLPGIAGMVLSIGMAVDSNVLIFERIKEELRSGRSITTAVSNGFSRALRTIVDTHVTTVAASAFLFMFGTGPVKGFAVTLVLGLVANLFTAVFVSRAIFEIQTRRRSKASRLSIGLELMDPFKKSAIDFMKWRKLALGVSLMTLLISISGIVACGLKPGIDFRGGMLLKVRIAGSHQIEDLRKVLIQKLKGEISVQETAKSDMALSWNTAGSSSPHRERGFSQFIIGTELSDGDHLADTREKIRKILNEQYGTGDNKMDLNAISSSALFEHLKTAFSARAVVLSDSQIRQLASKIIHFRDKENAGWLPAIDSLSALKDIDPAILRILHDECSVGRFQILSAEIISPRASSQMRTQALIATMGALGGMLLYIAFRFKWLSGVAAILATIHDVILTLGLFAFMGREINLSIVAALLALIGYSMNDKIVVFDRVRENLRSGQSAGSFLRLVNDSINQTLSRTLLTAGPTLLACLALYFLGGEVLNGIAFALFTGILAGTYSSIFVASSLLVLWKERAAQSHPSSALAQKP